MTDLSTAAAGPAVTARPRPHRRRLVPHQHGAWAFLLLPVVLGGCVAAPAPGGRLAMLPVVVAWVAAYGTSWAVSGLLVARPWEYQTAIRVWGSLAATAGIVAVLLRPWLWWMVPVLVVLFAVNVCFVRVHRERALANDIDLVLGCSVMVPVTAGVLSGAAGWVPPWDALLASDVLAATLVSVLVLVGSTLHVKSLIRERRNPAYAAASRWFALACVPVVAVLASVGAAGWWIVPPFVLLALRALLLRRPDWRPSRIGMVELAGFLAVAGGAVLAW